MNGAHSHAGHAHAHAPGSGSLRSLLIALALNAGFTTVEAVVGFATGSLALLGDAGHNLSDVLALGIAAGAVILARSPATLSRSFGLKRAEILAALLNAVTLIVIAVLIFAEAAHRLANPVTVSGGWVVGVAAVGLLINALGAAAVFRRDRSDLNLRASFIHLAGDALGSLGVIVAGVVIVTTGWRYADPLFSVLLGVLILASSWSVLRDALLVLLEAAPRGMDVGEIGRRIASYPGVVEAHDLHVWTISSDFPALSVHVLVRPGADCHGIRRELEQRLRSEFAIGHTTIQVDHAGDQLLSIRGSAGRVPRDEG